MLKQSLNDVHAINLIRKSKYFDSAYYYKMRPDVLAAGVDAATHYYNQGWREGANPSEKFNTAMFLAHNDCDGCPLLYYLVGGCQGDYSLRGVSRKEILKCRTGRLLRRAKTACYVYVSAGYDDLLSHRHIVPEWDYICFTDDKKLLRRKQVGIWQIKPSMCTQFDTKRNSGWHKTHPEICCAGYENSVWIDANVNVLTDYLVNQINTTNMDLLVPIHYERDCIYDEVDAVIAAGRDTVEMCQNSAKFLAECGMPHKYGLNETNIVFRRHNTPTVRAVDALWWDCIRQYSKRDQLSFSYALWKNGINPSDIAINNTRTDAVNFAVIPHSRPETQPREYDIVYSIGRDCACSFYLQTNGLRLCSGPMDWITTADFNQRFDMLLSEFKDFMNPECFEFLPKNPNIFNDDKCDYYRNTKTGFDFYHDFPAGVPFEQSFPDVAAKYNRRIERFYKNIKSNKRVLLVYFSHYTNTPDDVIVNLCNKFCNKMCKKIDFLIIEHREGQYTPTCAQLTQNITRWHLHTWARDENGTIMVNGNEALVNPIFKEYKVAQPMESKTKYGLITSFRLHVLCSLIPVKKWRHAARHHIRRELKRAKNKSASAGKSIVTAPAPTPPADAAHAASEHNLLVYTYANQKYYDFAILYPIWVLATNKDAVVEIAIENLQTFSDKYRHLIQYYNDTFPEHIKFTQISPDFADLPGGTVRFVARPTVKAKYVYIGDVDIIVLHDICNLHIPNIEHNGLDFSNIKRVGQDKLSGLHFIEYDKMYPINLSGVDIYNDNDENVLYKLMENKKYKIPDEYTQDYRPLCGIHISYFSRPPLKTLTTNDVETNFPCWYDNFNNTKISIEDIELYNKFRKSDVVMQFCSNIKETDIDLRRIIQFIDMFAYYITANPELLKNK